MMSKRPVLAKKRKLTQRRDEEKVTLDRVLGLTCSNGSSLSLSSSTAVYPAGCTLVLYYLKRVNNYDHIINPTKKPITCVSLSNDGKFVAFGECGHTPSVQVWDISLSPPTHIISLQGHAFGVACLGFSPNGRYLISVGYQHDQNIHIWNWRSGVKLASNKITSKQVFGLSFSEDGSYFVTCGSRRVRFWYFDTTIKYKSTLTQPINGRSAILGEHHNNSFIAVRCGRGPHSRLTYSLTRSGLLCQFNSSRELDKLIDVKLSGKAYCMEYSQSFILCGCGDGVVRLFDPASLDYIISMPRPHPLNVELSIGIKQQQFITEPGKCPDTVALEYDHLNNKLVAVYNDHSLYVWDLNNIKAIGKSQSYLYHNACVWSVQSYPPLADGVIPSLSFVTCSSDNTVRFWNYPEKSDLELKNVYSKEIFHIIYSDQISGGDTVLTDSSRGLRSIQFSPDGYHLAIGDRQGNLRVYDLHFMDKIIEVMAHDAEILSLQYSPLNKYHPLLLASGSRDRLIHIFSVTEDYNHIHTIDDHSASITAVNFSISEDVLYLYTCGADKSLFFYTLDKKSFKRATHIADKSTIYDMIVDHTSKLIATASQDKLLRIYGVSSGKLKHCYKVCDEEGTTGLLKLSLDCSGSYVAVSGSDKCVYIMIFMTGEIVSKIHGHSEVITSLMFTNDSSYLLTTSGDSCIFVWRLTSEIKENIRRRLTESKQTLYLDYHSTVTTPTLTTPTPDDRRETYVVSKIEKESDEIDADDEEDDGFRFSVSKLPSWAQKTISADNERREGGRGGANDTVSGRWAERISNEQFILMEDKNDSSEGECSEVEIELGRNDVSSSEKNLEKEEDHNLLMEDEKREQLLKENEDESKNSNTDDTIISNEELVYPKSSGRDSVDPSMFKVATPERRSSVKKMPELVSPTGGDDDSSPDSTCSTPEGTAKSLSPHLISDESAFLKTHFESLTSENADLVFGPTHNTMRGFSPPPNRPSISTIYFNRRRSFTTGCIKVRPLLHNYGSPQLEQDTSTGSRDYHMTKPKDKENDDDDDDDDECKSHDSHVISETGSIVRFRPRAKGIKRSKITKEEIIKTRKRLEELGYSEYAESEKITEEREEAEGERVGGDIEEGDGDKERGGENEGGGGENEGGGGENEGGGDVVEERDNITSYDDLCVELDDVFKKCKESLTSLEGIAKQSNNLSLNDSAKFKKLLSNSLLTLSSQLTAIEYCLNPPSNQPAVTVATPPATEGGAFHSLLETYSDKLVELVKLKLNTQ